ncbi:MAG: polysaccharide deacetylase family protein [Gammaproteobacteria bacterium]
MGRLSCSCLAAVLWAGASGAQQMAITFDDLPSHGELPPNETRLQIADSILSTLKSQHLPPTYGFLNGAKVEQEPATEAVLKAWRNAGQPLGNHTWAHLDINDLSATTFAAEIQKNEPLLQKYMAGEDWHWFRYPYLHEGDTLKKRRAVRSWLERHGYRVAQVNMDFEDYLWNAPYARCVAQHDDAAIARLHDSYLATAEQFIAVFRALSQRVYGRDVKYVLLLHVGAFDARMLPELLSLYRNKGFSFISLAEAQNDPSYMDDPDIGSKDGGALLELMLMRRHLKVPDNSKPYKELENTCK